MRPDAAHALGSMTLWAVPVLLAMLALQRPSERLGATVHRYRVLVLGWLGLGMMFLYGGWVVLAYAAIALVALVGLGYIAEALHKHHTRVEQRAGSR